MSAVRHGREKAVRFGSSASLIGVMTEAAADTARADRPAFIFLNSGILHRVGSCRFHVRVARALSAAGFHSLRFDYSGIGDSDQRRDALSFEESAVIETREAMDYLTRTKGTTRFVLMGLCSGADMAHETAVVDERVAGMMSIDAWAYRTLAYKLRRYGPKLLRLSAWRNSVGIRLGSLRANAADSRGGAPDSSGVEYEVPKYVRVFPPRSRVEAELKTLVARGVRMYYLWTGGLEEYNHLGQHANTFRGVGFGSLLREEHLPESDHIMSGLEHQEHISRSVVSWAQEFDGESLSTATMPRKTG